MSENLSSMLKKFREEKSISQIELANRLDCSRAIISSWEDGSSIPPRDSVIRMGKEFKINADDIDKLLELSGHEKLSGDEVINLISSNILSLGIAVNSKFVPRDLSNFFNSTGTYMGGTVNSLDEKIHAIENTLGQISASVLESKTSQNFNLVEEIENRIGPITQEVKSIKDEIVPQLETTQEQLKKSDEFLRRNAEFFISAVEGEGTIKLVGNQVNSIEKRLDKVESQVNVTRDRTIAVISIIIALVSVCIAFTSLGILIYTTLGSYR